MDPARAAAGIITGIGFLGAGTILKGKDFVKGLTTAASIWVVAAIGITTGLGQYYLSMATTALVLFTLLVLDKIDIRSGHYGEIHLEGRGGIAFFETVQKKLTQLGFAIKGHSINVASPSGIVKLHLTVRYKGHAAGSDLISALSQIGGVKEISWEK
jgi:putative Mg2+ transporter-C (MgtC) family protein